MAFSDMEHRKAVREIEQLGRALDNLKSLMRGRKLGTTKVAGKDFETVVVEAVECAHDALASLANVFVEMGREARR